jgi:hypothetical protein
MSAAAIQKSGTMEPTGLPRPGFSERNPYWVDYAKFFPFIHAPYRKRNNGHDFLAAAMWERVCADTVGAYCVRQATVLTLRIQAVWLMRQQVKELWIETRLRGRACKARQLPTVFDSQDGGHQEHMDDGT